MTKTLAIAVTLALAVASGAFAKDKAPGVKCGDSYIAAGKVCHKPTAPMCKLGKPCGKSCIAKDRIATSPSRRLHTRGGATAPGEGLS